jgi:hypothetical protein
MFGWARNRIGSTRARKCPSPRCAWMRRMTAICLATVAWDSPLAAPAQAGVLLRGHRKGDELGPQCGAHGRIRTLERREKVTPFLRNRGRLGQVALVEILDEFGIAGIDRRHGQHGLLMLFSGPQVGCRWARANGRQ